MKYLKQFENIVGNPRDGIYCRENPETGQYYPDCYLADKEGNVFYQPRVKGNIVKIDMDKFNKSKQKGYSFVRNLTDNEFYALKNIL